MVAWINIVEELFNNINNIIISCPSCTDEDPCISILSKTLPTDIQVLPECCACLLENVLETKQNLYRVYNYDETGEAVAIYKLEDAIIEISSTTATVVPINKVDIYIEILEEMGARDLESLKKLVKGIK